MVDFLDTFIGLFSIYLILSLIVTAFTQGMTSSSLVNLKGHIIRRIMVNLVGEEHTQSIIAHKKFQELCSRTLILKRQRLPSYLDPTVFAEILIEVKLGLSTELGNLNPARIEQAIAALDKNDQKDGELNKRLTEMWERADFDIAAFQAELVAWFDRVAERSYGWHKRGLNFWLLSVGFVVAVAINADTIYIFQRLTSDEDLRLQSVNNAIEFTESLRSEESAAADDAANEADPGSTASEADAMLIAICEQNGGTDCATDVENRSRTVVKSLLPDLLPVVGWDAMPDCLKSWSVKCPAGENGMALLALKIIGWFLTALATSLGAPFWFDLLQKLVQVRGKVVPGGNKPKDTEGKDGQPVTRKLAAKTALRASEVDATEIDSLNEFNHNNFGFDPVNIYWSARLAATAYLPDEDVEVFLAEYGAEGELLDIAHSDTQCLVAKTAKAAFISFRGTEKVAKDWFTDIDVKLTDSNWGSSTVKTHSGFTEALDSIWRKQSGATQPGIMDWIEANELAAKGIPIWFSGHSLGGALAALAALRLDMEQQGKSPRCVIAAIHTFGQPRVGDEQCAKEFDQRFANKYFRLINQRDIVPRVPFPKADILLARVKERVQEREQEKEEKVDTHTIAPEAIDIGKQEDYRYAHAGRVIYFSDLGRAIVDPQFWYRKLDTLVVPLDREQIKDALKQTAGDHAMTGYIERSRALFRFSEPDGGDD
jgi:hypothetical protein